MRVRQIREAKGYNQLDLAALLNVEIRQVRRIELGEGKIGISIENIYRVALALNVHPKELFDFDL